MPRGVFIRTKPIWNKGQYNIAFVGKVIAIMSSNPMPLTLGQIFTALGATGDMGNTRLDYKKFLWHMAKARATGLIDNNRITEGRGRGYEHSRNCGAKNKFNLGDKVRIKRHNKRTPEWLREELRIDTPRTITGLFRTGRFVNYYLGDNRLGSGILEPHTFRAIELIPYVKGSLGRPMHKRRYNRNPSRVNETNSILLVGGNKSPAVDLAKSPSIIDTDYARQGVLI